jgi:hypothetical protein
MRISRTLVILILAIAGCNKREKTAQASGVENCELHHRPLKKVSGYAAGPDLMVDPGYGVTEFNTQFGDRYPHINRVALSSSPGDGWTKEMTVQVCEECERTYSQDFANYLKIDEKKRWDQYMEYLTKHRPIKSTVDKSASDGGKSDSEQEPLIPKDLPKQ